MRPLFFWKEVNETENNQQNRNAFQMSADVARDAKSAAKIAGSVASGNVVGAAKEVVKNPRFFKAVLCIIISVIMLISCCLYAVPSMIWEASESVIGTIYATGEDVIEGTSDTIYYMFYGSGDGHEGLSGILETINREFNPFSMVKNLAVAGWEIVLNGAVSDDTKNSLPLIVQGVFDNLYGSDSGNNKYAEEASAPLYSGYMDSEGSLDPNVGMGAAYAMKESATRMRIGGRISDLRAEIDKDARVKFEASKCDSLDVSVSSVDEQYVARLMLAFYTVQHGASLDSVTLAEYCNWLGMSKASWLERGLFVTRYEYKPKLAEGDSFGSNEVGWSTAIQHWGGELLPQDLYKEYDYFAEAAVRAEGNKDSHFTPSDRYQIRQQVMNGQYKMDEKQEYPNLCTDEAYSTNYARVWYNSDKNAYYDRGALDIMVYPSPKIHSVVETYQVGETICTRLCLDYKIQTLEMEQTDKGMWWKSDSEKILTDILKFAPMPTYTNQSSNEVRVKNMKGVNIAMRSPLALTTASARDGESKKPMVIPSDAEGWELKYFSDLMETTSITFAGVRGANVGAGGGGGDMVSIARSQIGVRENGGGNNCIYNDWYGQGRLPWCAVFISWCAEQCGYLSSGLIPRTAHSATFWNYVLSNPEMGSLYTPSDVRTGSVTPMAGDILIVSGNNNQEAPNTSTRANDGGNGTRHVALVVAYDASSQRIATIDGNVSDSVAENSYHISSGDSSGRRIWGFVRPNYPNTGSEISGGISHKVSGLDMDTDGSTDPEDMKDPYYQPTTSITTADGKYYDASKVNYVVVAKNQSRDMLGCLVTIKDEQTGQVINCISADTGPREDDWNEVSVCAGRSLGYKVSGNVGVGKQYKFTITYYPDCKLTLYANGHGSINSQIDSQAALYKQSVDGENGYSPDFDASTDDGRID